MIYTGKYEGRKAERLRKRTGLTVHKKIYRAEKFKYYSLLLDSKVTYLNERITKCCNDSKATSKNIDDLLSQHKKTKFPAYCSALDLAIKFAIFFKGKTDKVRDELPDCSDIDQDKPTSNLVFFKPRNRRCGRSYANILQTVVHWKHRHH